VGVKALFLFLILLALWSGVGVGVGAVVSEDLFLFLLRVREDGGDTVFSLKTRLALTWRTGFRRVVITGGCSRTRVEIET